jgi:excisionase family DNA binding protein
MKTYSTREAAKLLGIGMMTMNRYIAAGKISVPPVQNIGGNRFRAWTQQDVERVRKMLPKIKNGRKHRKRRNDG